MHYYQFNIGDYSSHTSRLSILEDLAYRRLLDLYYLNERPFNGCLEDIVRDIGMPNYENEVEYVLGKFFPKDNDLWINKRVDKEIDTYHRKLKSAKAAGIASGKARKLKASERPFNKRSTNVQPNINHKPINNISRFAEFWVLYNKKINKPKCEAKFNKLKKSDIHLIFRTLPSYIKSTPDKQFRKSPLTYLNNQGWNDEITTSNGLKQNAPSTIPVKTFDFSEMNKAEENKSSQQSVKKMLSEAGIK